jgi:hypothetical protein
MKAGWLRASIAVALLVLIGYFSWESIPHRRSKFTREQLLANRQLVISQFWMQPDLTAGDITRHGTGQRMGPGSEMRFQISRVTGILRGRFNASSSTGTTIDLASLDQNNEVTPILRREIPATPGAEKSIYYFLLDPHQLPTGTVSIRLSVPADAPGNADWQQIDEIPHSRANYQSVFSLPWLAYEGFAYPTVIGSEFLAHAPSQLILSIPAEAKTFSSAFGYNAAVFSQKDGASDGIEFKISAQTSKGTQLLHQQIVEFVPQSLRSVTLQLSDLEPKRLLLEMNPGPRGDNSWDWSAWAARANP